MRTSLTIQRLYFSLPYALCRIKEIGFWHGLRWSTQDRPYCHTDRWEVARGQGKGVEMAVSGVGIWDTSKKTYFEASRRPFQSLQTSKMTIFRVLTANRPKIELIDPKTTLFRWFGS
jgi:hypothetical protein